MSFSLQGKMEILVALSKRLPVGLYRIEDKIVTGTAGHAWVTELSKTAARVVYEGELQEWQDVHVSLLDNTRKELPGRLYGKVMHVKPGAPLRVATVHSRRLTPTPWNSSALPQARAVVAGSLSGRSFLLKTGRGKNCLTPAEGDIIRAYGRRF